MRSLLKSATAALPSAVRDPIQQSAILYEHSGVREAGIDAEAVRLLATQFHTVAVAYGGARSFASKRCVDAHGRPIPWYTYPAIEFLDAYDWSGASVFEYGSGHSTLWWAARAAHVAAVESVAEWATYVRTLLPAHATLFDEPEDDPYARAVHREGRRYDVIVVDGKARSGMRYICSREAAQRLNAGGIVVLDNSDYLPRSCSLFRNAGMIEVPFAGLVPLNSEAGITTVFLSRDFAWPRRRTEAPLWAVGGAQVNWESDDEEGMRCEWRTAT